MKAYTKKLLFGGGLMVTLGLTNFILITQPNANEMWYIILFAFAMKAGIVIWIILLIKEHFKLLEENYRRKNK